MRRFHFLPVLLVLAACTSAEEGAVGAADAAATEPDGVASATDLGAPGAAEDVPTAVDTGSPSNDLADPAPDASDAPEPSMQDVAAEDVAPPEGDAELPDVSPAGDAEPALDANPPKTIAEQCFPGVQAPGEKAPVYDPFAPVMGSHCFGTNHQDITGVQQVVFIGDSVTVGTPNDEHLIPTENDHYYRNRLTEWLATHFNLDKGNLLDYGAWKSWDYIGFSGKGMKQVSGAFSNCSKWGARTDDLLTQLGECFPTGTTDKKTLVVFTMGGNDVAALTQAGGDATPEEVAAGYPEAWKLTQRTIEHLEAAMVWLKDPARFPNGVYVVFANPFEFTDGTGVTSACKPAQIEIPFIGAFDLSQIDVNMAQVAGFKDWVNKEIQKEMVVWMLEQYMRIATQYQVDLMLMLENFCGHGYVATGPNADPENRCYKGPDAALWFDITCFHPSEAGHAGIAAMFQAVIEE